MSSIDLGTEDVKVVKTVCQLCVACCGIDAYVKDGKVIKVTGMKEHPINKGRLCPKGAAILDYVYSPDRLKYPLKRVEGGWKRISWDEALDTIATKLKDIQEKEGSRSLGLCMGMAMLDQGRTNIELIRRFVDLYGTPNVFSVDSMCFRLRVVAYTLTFGRWAVYDVENARCAVLWGHNPEASTPPRAWMMAKSKPKLIVIDPRRTPIAQKADIHVQPRPGTDGALALALLNVIVSEKLYDKAFVERWTVGFDKLVEHVAKYTPEEAEKITWVPAQRTREIARLFATTKPACIVQGWNSLDETTSGLQTSRSVAILQAITGNFDVPGGFTTPPRQLTRPGRLMEKVEGLPLGTDTFPLNYSVLGHLFGEGQAMVLPETLLTGKPYPIKALIIHASNPILSWPNANKMREALKKLDLLVVMDLFMTETAQLADIVLPAASFLERDEIVDLYPVYNLPYLMMRKKAIEFGECWSDLKFWWELGKKLGYLDYFPARDIEGAFDYILQPGGVSVERLRNEASGMFFGTVQHRQYEKKGLRSPSGKVEIYSEHLKSLGHDPLPVYREPLESPVSTPELAKEYPLILTTGARLVEYIHSQLRNIPRLRKRAPDPVVEIHPDSAAKYGVSNGELVVVETKRGSIEVMAKVTGDILPGVINIAHGWSEANVNVLTDETPADTVVGNPALKALLCRVRPKGG